MKIGVIGISGKGKSTLLNHLINTEIASSLSELIGPINKEKEISGQTKNPVRYKIIRNLPECTAIVSQLIDKSCIDTPISFPEVIQYAKSDKKCTVTLTVTPSHEFESIMSSFNLNELEFIDTQGLLDSLEQETAVPLEIKECAVLLYLYDSADQGSRGDYIKKYRSFLNSISDKPLIFLETATQWQIMEKDIDNLHEWTESALCELDKAYSIPPEAIRERYSILTNNDAYTNSDTFILSSVLSASKSSVNYYRIKLSTSCENYLDDCLRLCAAHTLNQVFDRLSGIKKALVTEFDKVNGDFDRKISYKACYDLLWDVFIKQWQRVDSYTGAKVLRFGRHDFTRFKSALKSFNDGSLFTADFTTTQYEIHTQYGYHCIYETYENQDLLDCMQLFVDLYNAYLQRLSVKGNRLSKAIQVYLLRSITVDLMCRDTGYDIPILNQEIFEFCINRLEKWVGTIPVTSVVYSKYEDFDIAYPNKETILLRTNKYVSNTKSLISKLDYMCMTINNKIQNKATQTILNNTQELVE